MRYLNVNKCSIKAKAIAHVVERVFMTLKSAKHVFALKYKQQYPNYKNNSYLLPTYNYI